MFIPNTTVKHSARNGYDGYGQPLLGSLNDVPAAVVKIEPSAVQTSVRADSSGSRGAADELDIEAIFLVPGTTAMKVDDMVEIDGLKFEVRGVQTRRGVDGLIDHLEILAKPKG